MSADVVVVFYGLRFIIVDQAELTQLEDRTHPHIRAASMVGLEDWWGLLPDSEDDYYLLLGIELGTLGWEDDFYESMAEDELRSIMDATKDKCRQAGFSEVPALHVQFEPKG